MNRKPLAVVAAGLFAMFALTGCIQGPNYEGTGNAFDGIGTVTKVRDHTYDVQFRTVKIADGRSSRHVKAGQTASVHDNFRYCNDWGLQDQANIGPSASTVKVGSVVHVTGARRENAGACGEQESHDFRLVGQTVTPVPQ